MAGKSAKPEKPDARGGRFLLLPSCLVTSEAFRTASPRAIKALLVIWQHHNGFNNGLLGVGFRELAEGMDSQYHAGNIAAVGELVARGIVALSADHPKAQRLAREYRLTFIPTAGAPATHDYLQWREGDAGSRRKPIVGAGTTRKNGLADTATETTETAADTATRLEKTVADTATGKTDNDANPPFSFEASAADTATHIVNQFVPLNGVPKSLPGGERPNPVAPEPDELRARVLGLVGRFGRGTQSKLAKHAALSIASMSRFLNGASDLDERSRIRLTCAIPKVELLCTGAPLQFRSGGQNSDALDIRNKIAAYFAKLSAKRQRAWAEAHGVTRDDIRKYIIADPDHLPAPKIAALVLAIRNEKAEQRRQAAHG